MLVLGGVIGLSSLYIVYQSSSKSIQNSVSSNQLAIAKQTIGNLDQYLYEREIDIQSTSYSQQLINFLTMTDKSSESVTTFEQSLNSVANVSADWSEIEVYNATGQLVASAGNNQQPYLMGNNPALSTVYNQVLAGETEYSDAFLPSGSNVPTMAFMSPIRTSVGGGNTVGVLEGYIAWPTILEVLQSLTNSSATLLNSQGKLLGTNQNNNTQANLLSQNYANSQDFKYAKSSAPGSKVLPGLTDPKNSYVTSYVDEDGYLNYHGNKWSLILETSKKVAFSPVTQLSKILVLIFVVFLASSVLAFTLALNKLVIRPIRTLKSAIGLLAAGDFSKSIDIQSHDELEDLSKGLNEMSVSIQNSNQKFYEEHARLLASINGLEVGYIMTDLNKHISLINNSANKLLGIALDTYSTGNLGIEQVTDLFKGSVDLPKILDHCLDKHEIADIKEFNFNNRILHIIIGPILIKTNDSNSKGIGCVILLEDITETIVAARSKDEFFSIASHELRTPLTSIKGNSSMVMEFYPDILKDQPLKEMIEDIHSSSERLIAIVNDFLDVSRLEQKRMSFNYSPVSLEKVVEKVVYEMGAVVKEKNLYLNYDPASLKNLPNAWADKNRLEQVIYNLVGNALKFTEHGGITLTAELDSVKNFIKVLVADTGRGMTFESQQLLFHKFQQASSSILTRDTTRGTGLGLYISKMIIENMGGRINLEESVVDKGTTFSFTIPVSSILSQAAKANSSTQTDVETGLSKSK